MHKMMLILLTLLLGSLLSYPGLGQHRIKLKQANTLHGSIRDGERFDQLTGNVVLMQKTTTIYCDSAFLFKSKNRVEAYGNIHIVDGDSIDITAKNLIYEGNQKKAFLRGNVIFTKLSMATLYTDFLDFDRLKNKAYYFNHGKLVDSVNTLTSQKGHFNTNSNLAAFQGEVICISPDMTMRSDTLLYDVSQKVVHFIDDTYVEDKEGRQGVYAEGTYNTILKSSVLQQGVIETPRFKLTGDTYLLDNQKKIYRLYGHIVMTSLENDITVYGNKCIYNKNNETIKVYDHAYVAKPDEKQDTLFLAADTLMSVEDSTTQTMLYAFRNVRIYKSDLQGIADSLVYFNSDSLLHLYGSPVLWEKNNQMSSDSIHIQLQNDQIHKAYMINHAFIINQDSLFHYNQIKGRTITASFYQNAIHHVEVEGNGESLYYVMQEPKNQTERMDTTATASNMEWVGLNKMVCSNMKIRFKNQLFHDVSFYVKPDAVFIPPHKVKDEDKYLSGFLWRWKEKPNRHSLHIKLPLSSPTDTK